MINPGIEADGQASCPKRLWVMLTLSDDEALPDSGRLPQGLQFHLSRCPSCRTLAEQLTAVSTGLRDLAQREPGKEVAVAANRQLRQAMRDGAKLTGRVAIVDETDSPGERGHADTRRTNWRHIGWFGTPMAAAAVIVFVALLRVWGPVGPSGREDAGESMQAQPRVAKTLLPGEERMGVLSVDGKGPDSAPDGLGAIDLTSEPADESPGRLAAADSKTTAKSQKRVLRVCRHNSYSEAASCEDATCVHRAIILPRRGQPQRRTTTRP